MWARTARSEAGDGGGGDKPGGPLGTLPAQGIYELFPSLEHPGLNDSNGIITFIFTWHPKQLQEATWQAQRSPRKYRESQPSAWLRNHVAVRLYSQVFSPVKAQFLYL